MHKTIKTILLISVGVLVTVGTPPMEYPEVKNLDFEVVSDTAGIPGGAVKLNWDFPDYWVQNQGFSCGRITGVDPIPSHFEIYADNVLVGSTDTNFFTVYVPCTNIEVFAVYDDDDESWPEEINLELIISSGLDIWSSNDPSQDHPSGFGFDINGTAFSYLVSAEFAEVDYWLWEGADESTPTLMSPSEHEQKENQEINRISQDLGIYREIDVIPAQSGFNTSQSLADNAVYGLEFTGDDSLIHYAKMQVVGMDAQWTYRATLNLAFQPVPGLRWVVTD